MSDIATPILSESSTLFVRLSDYASAAACQTDNRVATLLTKAPFGSVLTDLSAVTDLSTVSKP